MDGGPHSKLDWASPGSATISCPVMASRSETWQASLVAPPALHAGSRSWVWTITTAAEGSRAEATSDGGDRRTIFSSWPSVHQLPSDRLTAATPMVDPATAIASSTMGVTVPVAEETSHSWRGVPGMAIETEVRVPSTLSTMNMPGSRVAPTSAYPAGRLSALTRPSVEIVTSAAAPVRTYPPPASGSSDPPAAQVRYQPAAVGRGIRCASPEVPTMASPRDPSGIAASVASVEPSVTALSSREPGRRSKPGDQVCDAESNHHRRPARLPIEEMSPSARRRSPCHPTSVSSPAGGSREG